MVIVLIGERPISWNTLYQGGHWGKREKTAEEVHTLVRGTLLGMGVRAQGKHLYDVPVDIRVVVYFKDRPLDSDNIPAKIYVDGLKEYVLRDDTRKYVRNVTTRSEIDHEHPRTEIHITPYVEDVILVSPVVPLV